jgi:regulator of replication initiation timing
VNSIASLLVKIFLALLDLIAQTKHVTREIAGVRRDVGIVKCEIAELKREVKALRDQLEHPDLRAMIVTVGVPTEES